MSASPIGVHFVALVSLAALFLLGLAAPLDAQTRQMQGPVGDGVRTDERDVTVVLGGEVAFDAVVQNKFFRSANDERGWEFVSALLRLDLDVRFTDDVGLYAALQTERRETIPAIGSDFPRSSGFILGEHDPGIEVTELFIDANRLLGIDWSLRGGLAHFQLGLETGYEDPSGHLAWGGHGRLVFDTLRGRGRYHDRIRPVGLHVSYAFNQHLSAVGYFSWLGRDLSDDSQDTWIAAVEGRFHRTNRLDIHGGFLNLFDNNGPDMQMIWGNTRVILERFLHVYGEAVFQLGNDQSGTAWYGGVQYQFDGGRSMIDVSFWHVSGNDTATLLHQEGYQSFGHVDTLMLTESYDYGMGRQRNYTAFKVVASIPIEWNLRLRLAWGRFNAEDSSDSPRPGDEANVFLTYYPSKLVQLEAGFAFLYGSRIFGDDADDTQGWMAVIRARAHF